jgi:hypothetical protein
VSLTSALRLWDKMQALPAGGRVRPGGAETLRRCEHDYDADAMAAPLPGGGSSDGGGLTADQARDLATIRDALMERFGTAGAGGAGAGAPAGNAAGGGGTKVRPASDHLLATFRPTTDQLLPISPPTDHMLTTFCPPTAHLITAPR